ncbi:ATP-binding SpoIIE family protein phosphatase [Polymorphospora rubra]|uniref:ATP-binding SpoIIE family protein phosphatase n=1 Tax=Polymorphospora rubra TaxID=338584 RepID=UPI00340969DB
MPATAGRIPAVPVSVPAARMAGGPRAVEPARPWSQTGLGDPSGWDPALRAIVDLVLGSPVAMALAYGDELTLVYNDAYAAVLGVKHPEAFGRPAPEVHADVWAMPGVGDVFERVRRTGEPYLETEASLPVVRAAAGTLEHAVFTRGLSAVRDGRGRIVGVLTVAAETTQVTRRLQDLSALASALSATLTLDDVARVALRYAVSSLDVHQAAFGVDDGTGWRMTRRVRGEVLDEADERLPPLWRRLPGDSTAPLVAAATDGTATFRSDGQPLRRTALDRHDQKVRALAALPLRTASLRGALTFGLAAAHPWAPAERALLAATAELVAQAAERARRFETQHGTAQLLQRSMLPEHLPDIPRFRIAARYEAGVDGNAAGGDFYDAFPLAGGRLAVVLGDVAGHDVRAAALMGQVRAALRALALTDPDPASVLRGLDRLVANLAAEMRSDEIFVTVTYGVADPEAGRLTLASAGHPAPLLRRSATGPDPVPAAGYLDVPPGPPLGLGGRRAAVAVDFAPGDTVLLFSDGVVERRGRGLAEGFDALAAAVSAAGGSDPRSLCAVAVGAVPGPTEDDVAVLAVEHASRPSRSAGIQVPAEPTAPGRVRHWMTAQLTEWAVPESVVAAAVLCTSELTTNALLHAGTSARVEIDLSSERLLVSVADRGTRGTVTRTQTDRLSSRGRGLSLIEQLSDAWGTDPTVRGSTVWFEILIPEGQAGVTPAPDG